MNVFRSGDRYVFALTYGECEWVANVLAGAQVPHPDPPP